jgi:hypothetical protein
MEAVHATSNSRVKALNDSAIRVIGAGAKDIVALVGDAHREGIAAGLEKRAWSVGSEIVQEPDDSSLAALKQPCRSELGSRVARGWGKRGQRERELERARAVRYRARRGVRCGWSGTEDVL